MSQIPSNIVPHSSSYASTLVQTEGPAPNGLAGVGGPALPAPQDHVRGEHQWTTWANNVNDWSDHQTEVANTRIPYASTLLQTETESPFGLAGAGGPALPSPQPKVRGEHQWTTWANNVNDWSDHQTEVANTRIPYASTLVQLEGPAPYGLAGPGGPALPSP